MKKLDERENGVQKKHNPDVSKAHHGNVIHSCRRNQHRTVGCPRDEELGVASSLVL